MVTLLAVPPRAIPIGSTLPAESLTGLLLAINELSMLVVAPLFSSPAWSDCLSVAEARKHVGEFK